MNDALLLHIPIPDLTDLIQQYTPPWLMFKLPLLISPPNEITITPGEITILNPKLKYPLSNEEWKKIHDHNFLFLNRFALGRCTPLTWSLQIKESNDPFEIHFGLSLLNRRIGFDVTYSNELIINDTVYRWPEKQDSLVPTSYPPHTSHPIARWHDPEPYHWKHFSYHPHPDTNTFEFKVAFVDQANPKTIPAEKWKDIVQFLDPLWNLDDFQHAVPFIFVGKERQKLIMCFVDQTASDGSTKESTKCP